MTIDQNYLKELLKIAKPLLQTWGGRGNDTLYLIEKAKKVIPCDYSQNIIQNIQKNFPEIERAGCY